MSEQETTDKPTDDEPMKVDTSEPEGEKKEDPNLPKKFNKFLLYLLIGLMILTGTVNTVFNKILQKLKAKGILFEQHHWIITFGMFLGEMVSLIPYSIIVYRRRRKRQQIERGEIPPEPEDPTVKKKPPVKTNLIFAITAACDLMATTVNTFGLTYLTTSMFQMMRGMELFFVCLWSKIFLKNPIYRHNLLGVGSLIFGLALVGVNAIINQDKDKGTAKSPGIGILLMCVSQLFSSTEYILQEKFVVKWEVNSFQLVGFEGLWGSTMYGILLGIFQVCSCNSWPDTMRENICFTRPEVIGKPMYSRIEDTQFAFEQMGENKGLLVVYIFYVISIAMYNIVGINLTKLVSSTARAVVDTVRTVFIWLFFLIFHPVEGTKENFYVLQLIGFLFLLAGTLVYNEILPLRFWNMDYFTRDKIRERQIARIEQLKARQTGNDDDRLLSVSRSDA